MTDALRRLLKLTWLEVKIFAREPLGLFGSIGMPVVLYVVLGRIFGGRVDRSSSAVRTITLDVPVFATILIAISAVLSLVTIVSIYRESGILKRLRATPLGPVTILSAQVLVRLLMTVATMALMFAAGRRYYPAGVHIPVVGFTAALILSTLSILSIGFLIASLVPTARFAQPLATFIFYPMIAISGLFFPIAVLPPAVRVLAHMIPITYGVSLLRGVLAGDPWSAHIVDVAALLAVMAVFGTISSRVFRWE